MDNKMSAPAPGGEIDIPIDIYNYIPEIQKTLQTLDIKRVIIQSAKTPN
jgi:hypothetical protein